jgi:RNA polymerase primary sigma factor
MGVGASSVNCYIKSIPRDALLTKEEEIHLANVMRNGSDREKREARERFITANLPLVVFIAKRYMRDGVCFGDIVRREILASSAP